MASERQIAANRLNAAKSTGPRSTAGKRRARANAYRHGCAAAVLSPVADEQVAELGQAIAEGNESVVVLRLAKTAAEATLDIMRIQKVRNVIVAQIAATKSTDGNQQSIESNSCSDKLDPYMQLQALDRYRRRLASRRDRAIRNIVRYTRGNEGK